MSILIKGMEMPVKKNGAVLIIYPEGNCVFEDGSEYKAVSVPPHGRLGDLDQLKELFREVIGNIAKRKEIEPALEHMVRASAMVIEMIDDAPTIIEAEDGEK